MGALRPRERGETELRELLAGDAASEDTTGLLAVAESGSSVSDLAELTGRAPYTLEKLLHGRVFTGNPRILDINPELGYRFGHEALREQSVIALGPARIGSYRDLLRAWAERYRRQGWPVDTPAVLAELGMRRC